MGMAQWLLVVATFLVIVGGGLGLRAVRHGYRSRWTMILTVLAFVCQTGVLSIRGEMRGKCPLGDYGEILVFLAWSLVLFYLVVGPTYRLSLLGLFTAPVVAVFQVVALLPGMLEADPVHAEEINSWAEAHAALAVLSYGAFALAAVAALMFTVLNRFLKRGNLRTSLFRNLPPAKLLLNSVVRLTVLGTVILTVAVGLGTVMHRSGQVATHLVAAYATWIAYFVLLGVYFIRGITPRRLSLAVISLFVLSLLVFAFV
jgi:ABC-type uncharacterized transport system permease subunit